MGFIFDLSGRADGSWWKAKLKDENGQEGAIGLIPAAYVEEVSSCERSSEAKLTSAPAHEHNAGALPL